jgi:hypothetical protein
VINDLFLECFYFEGLDGGCPVSGGGTLYMKWGAENNYSHKRGLWGEIIFYKIFYFIK